MKKLVTVALLLALLPALAGCTKGEDARELAGIYRQAAEVSARARVAVVSGQAVMDYTIDYRRDGEGATVSIVEPEALAGISARLGAGSAVIDYQGASVETLLPALPGLSPVDGLHGVLDDLSDGLAETVTTAEWGGAACMLLTFVHQAEGFELEKQVWLDSQSGAMRHCELFVDGQRVMTLDVLSLSLF